jgi:phosphomannomutase
VIWGDQLLSILAEPVLRELPGETNIADVKASQALSTASPDLAASPSCGRPATASQDQDEGNRLAARGRDERPHLLQAPFYGFDDAIYAGTA